MDLLSRFFPAWLWLGAWGAMGLTLGWALWRCRAQRATPSAANAWLGATVLMLVAHLLHGGIRPGLAFHLLGAALLTLLMGPARALLAVAVVLAVLCGYGLADWQALGLNWLLQGVLPVGVVTLALRMAQRYLPPNFFIYVFINGFVAASASYMVCAVSGTALLALFGAYPGEYLAGEVLPFYFLLSWSEAFVTGLMTAILVVYKPHWMSSFDDRFYLKDPLDDL